VTTAKDAVRMVPFAPAALASLEVDLAPLDGSFADLLGLLPAGAPAPAPPR